jgi:cell division protein FtsN
MAFTGLGARHKSADAPDAPRPDPHRTAARAKIERSVYVLQAGSYRNEADANRRRAQLALQGIPATVQRVAVDADVWHRVRIGPISNLDELNKKRRQLQAADIDALVIRVGD